MSVISRTLSVAFLLALATASATAATPEEIDLARNKGLAWLFANQQGDGSWKIPLSNLQAQPTAAVLEAYINAGVSHGYSFATAQAWLSNADPQSTDSLSRKCMALYRTGSNTATLITRLINMRHISTKSWGAYDQYYASFPDTSLALDALAITNTSYTDTGTSLGFISNRQNADGGWSYTSIYGEPGTSVSRVIPTSHNIATLSRYKTKGWNVDANITNGVNWLVARQKADGGFTDDLAATTGNPYETALAYLALIEAQNAGNAAAVAAQTNRDNARNFIIAQQQADGSWSGDPLSTALALQTLPTATLVDSDNDGIPDTVEALLLTNPEVADGRNLVKGNGDSVTGINTTVLLATIPVNRAFNMPLTVSGGTAPYTWSITSNGLPEGLLLGSSTGVISGIPITTGIFNFIYKVNDSVGLSSSTSSKIEVTPLPVLVRTTTVNYFDSLQAAYLAQPEGSSVTIQSRNVILNEDLTLDRDVEVFLTGGFDDVFENRTGVTTISGSLTIFGGSATVDDITIK